MAVVSLVSPRVLDSMMPFLTCYYGNPHSRTHQYGWESEKAMEVAREQVTGQERDRLHVLSLGGQLDRRRPQGDYLD